MHRAGLKDGVRALYKTVVSNMAIMDGTFSNPRKEFKISGDCEKDHVGGRRKNMGVYSPRVTGSRGQCGKKELGVKTVKRLLHGRGPSNKKLQMQTPSWLLKGWANNGRNSPGKKSTLKEKYYLKRGGEGGGKTTEKSTALTRLKAELNKRIKGNFKRRARLLGGGCRRKSGEALTGLAGLSKWRGLKKTPPARL